MYIRASKCTDLFVFIRMFDYKYGRGFENTDNSVSILDVDLIVKYLYTIEVTVTFGQAEFDG